LKTAKETIEDFLKQLDDFVNQSNTQFANFREEFLIVSDMSDEALKKMTKEELFDASYLLYGYASYVQDQINKQKIVHDLCCDQLEKMVARNNDKFSQYTKHESKLQLIILDNEYAKSIDNYKQVAHARLQSLEGKVYELKRKADILLEKGKRT
jgi:hypothetical protein